MTIDLSTLVGVVVTVLANLLTAIGLIISYIQVKKTDAEARQKEADRLTRIEVHVETLWDFHIRRSMVDATSKGVGTMNSPFTVNQESVKILASLREDMLDWYKKGNGHLLDDRQLFIDLGKAFGDRLTKEICVPYNIEIGTCLLIAVALVRGEIDGKFELNFPPIGAFGINPKDLQSEDRVSS